MRLPYRVALITLVIWCALIAFPALPPPTGLGLDPSWVLGINLAHVRGLAMGRDLVWTYGPLAFLSIPNPAGQHMWSGFLYRMSMYLLCSAVLLRLCVWLAPPGRGFWIALLFSIVAAMDPFLAGDHLEAAALLLSLIILVDESRWKSIELLLLSLLAATAMLVRYNLGVELIGVFLAVALQKNIRRQASPAIAALPVAILGLYVAATGHITTLWPYFRNGWELASGYSEAMSAPGPPLAVFGALVALVCLFGAALWIFPRCPRVWAAIAAAAIFAFFLFKNSMVRQDGPHVAPFFGKLALISLFFWILRSTRRSAASLVAFQIALLSTSYFLLDNVWPGRLPLVLRRLSLSETAGLARDYFHWPQTWRRFETEALRNLQPGWLPAPFHKAVGNGTVDAVPWNVSGIVANGWRWQPRPVFQSYAAFTPALDDLNARHIQSAAAADFALVYWETIDSRHLFFEDPSSWKARLDRYASDYSDNHALLMRRRASPIIRSSERLNFATIRWGQDAAVPPYDDWVVLHANVRPTPLGQLRKLLFRLDPIWLNVRFRSGHSQRWRAIRPNLENGILISQVPQDLGDISLLGRGCALPDPVVSVRLEASRPQDYPSDIAIEWEGLRGPQPPRAVNFDDNNPCLAPQPSVGSFPTWGGAGSLMVTAGSGTVWNATANSPWLRIISGAAGQGNRIVSYVVAANPSAAARTDVLYLERVPYRVEQLGLAAIGKGAQLGVFRIGGEAMPTPASSDQAPGFGDIVDSFGLPGDLPVMGDWNGDGRISVGVYRNGEWYLDLNGNRKWDGVEGGDGIFLFGLPGDTPVVGDWTGDGVTKLGVFRCPQDPHGGCTWVLDVNGNRRFDPNDIFLSYGLPGDIPIVSAWSGGKIDKIGVFRNGAWFVDSNGNGRFDPSDQRFVFGLAGDVPVVSRSRGKIGVYRSGKWLLDWNGDYRRDAGDREFVFGNPHDRPLIAEW